MDNGLNQNDPRIASYTGPQSNEPFFFDKSLGHVLSPNLNGQIQVIMIMNHQTALLSNNLSVSKHVIEIKDGLVDRFFAGCMGEGWLVRVDNLQYERGGIAWPWPNNTVVYGKDIWER